MNILAPRKFKDLRPDRLSNSQVTLPPRAFTQRSRSQMGDIRQSRNTSAQVTKQKIDLQQGASEMARVRQTGGSEQSASQWMQKPQKQIFNTEPSRLDRKNLPAAPVSYEKVDQNGNASNLNQQTSPFLVFRQRNTNDAEKICSSNRAYSFKPVLQLSSESRLLLEQFQILVTRLQSELAQVKSEFNRFKEYAQDQITKQFQLIQSISSKIWKEVKSIGIWGRKSLDVAQLQKAKNSCLLQSQIEKKNSMAQTIESPLVIASEKVCQMKRSIQSLDDSVKVSEDLKDGGQKLRKKSQLIIAERTKMARSQMFNSQLSKADEKKRQKSQYRFDKFFEAVQALKLEMDETKEMKQHEKVPHQPSTKFNNNLLAHKTAKKTTNILSEPFLRKLITMYNQNIG